MLRFGLVGCGTHAQWAVMPAINSAKGCRLVAVCDVVPEHLKEVKDDSVGRYTDFQEMQKAEDLDAIYVATPANVHCENTLSALEAGLHVLTEKPMAMTAQDCRQMIAAAEKAGRVLAVDFECRYYPGYRRARQWISEGRLGCVHAVHIHHMWSGHKNFGPLAERRARTIELSGSLDCGIHRIDIARYMCGGGTWRDVRASGAWFGEDLTFAPHISILARLDTGIIFTINNSMSFTAYIEPGLAHDSLAIVGTKGVIAREAGPDGPALHLVSETLEETCLLQAKGHDVTIVGVVEDFVAVVGGKPFPPELATGYDGLMAQVCTTEANRLAVEEGDACLLTPGAAEDDSR